MRKIKEEEKHLNKASINMDKNDKLPAYRILGQTPQNMPQWPCRVETSSGQHCGASAYTICIETVLFYSVTYIVCFFLNVSFS